MALPSRLFRRGRLARRLFRLMGSGMVEADGRGEEARREDSIYPGDDSGGDEDEGREELHHEHTDAQQTGSCIALRRSFTKVTI